MTRVRISKDDIDAIMEIVNPLLGHIAWNVRLGVESFITMEFGDPVTKARGRTRGEWFLWIYYCGWYLENPNGVFVGCEDPREILKQEITLLNEHRLEEVVISSIAFETRFIFDQGLVLHTFPLYFIDLSEHWKLYTPNGKILIIGPALNWSFESSSEAKSLN